MNLTAWGYFINKTLTNVSYNTRKQLWEFVGSSYLINIMLRYYYNNTGALDLVSNFRNGDGAPKEIITMYTAWYVYSHNYQIFMDDPVYDMTMKVHHIVTILLLALSYHYHLMYGALAVLFVLSLSNPFLHAAKLSKNKIIFAMFAATFTVMRLFVYPAWILRHTLFYPIPHLNSLEDYKMYVTCNSALLALYAMQWTWFTKITNILISAQR